MALPGSQMNLCVTSVHSNDKTWYRKGTWQVFPVRRINPGTTLS